MGFGFSSRLGFGACPVRSSGGFGVGAFYITLRITMGKNLCSLAGISLRMIPNQL